MPDEKQPSLVQIAIVAGAFALGRWTAPDRPPRKRLERDGVSYIKHVVREWRPINYTSEAECHLALQNYLVGRFSEDRLLVESQYGMGPSRVDIVVERKFAVEIKYALNSENEIKRLIGQFREMAQHFDGGLIVLCGPTDEAVVNRLTREIHRTDDQENLLFDVVHIPILVQKPSIREPASRAQIPELSSDRDA